MSCSVRSFVLFAALGLALSGCSRATPPPGPISARGGERFELLLDTPATHHLQSDPRWTNETVGGSDETIGAVGCTLCSVAMALNRAGVAIDPPTLNRRLKQHGGYTERGFIVWRAVAEASGDAGAARYIERFDHRTLDEALRAGRWPVVKVLLPGGVAHWVLIVGKAGDDYLARDPLAARRERVPLSRLAPQIHALRLIQRP